MPMQLEGSCRCGAVRFAVASHTPVPYQLCYCSICRKTAGGGGYAINLSADARTLRRHGRTRRWHATLASGTSSAERHACPLCASALWLFDPHWPDLIHPFASAIDTALPRAPSQVHIMLGSRPDWVTPRLGPHDRTFDELPEQSIEDWHRTHGLWLD